MCQFIESIRVENGEVMALPFHQKRVNATFQHFFPKSKTISLQKIIEQEQIPQDSLYKLRIVYSSKLKSIEFQNYTIPLFRKIQLIEIPSDFDYNFKSTKRELFDQVSKQIEHDTLVILIKNGLITDSTFSNLVFEKSGELYTPSKPLLAGTMLQQLLKEKRIKSIPIQLADFESFEVIYPINAMNPLGQFEGIKI